MRQFSSERRKIHVGGRRGNRLRGRFRRGKTRKRVQFLKIQAILVNRPLAQRSFFTSVNKLKRAPSGDDQSSLIGAKGQLDKSARFSSNFKESPQSNIKFMRAIRILVLIVLCSQFSFAVEDAAASQKRFGKVIALTGRTVTIKSDGTTADIRIGDELPPGTVIKTGNDSSVSLFFRRIGMILQVRTNTTLSLDKLEMEMKNGRLAKRTELSLSEGGILAFVRVLVPESRVLVRTPKASFQVPGTGMGRFEFWADGSVLVGRKSKLSVVADVSGDSSAVSPGQFFSVKSNNVISANPALLDAFSKKMDALQATAIQLTPPPLPEELPK